MRGALILFAVVLLGVFVFGLYRRLTDGRVKIVTPPSAGASGVTGAAAGARPAAMHGAQLGAPLGKRATLVQFSTEYCAPCRTTASLLGDIAAHTDGVRHIELDAPAHPDLVQQYGVTRTPTLLVLDGAGIVRARAVGAPRREGIQKILAPVLAGPPR